MRKRLGALVGLAVAASLSAIACSDAGRSLAPNRVGAEASNDLLGSLVGLLVAPVKRTTPLTTDVSWSFTAGSGGAVSSNSAVGLTVLVPPGALSSSQRITVTALAGSAVAYRFEPHLVFDRKVTLTQNLRGTSGGLLNSLLLKGAHFAGDVLDYTGGLVSVDETVPALLSFLTRTASFGVGHFSGWVLASGAVDGSE